MYWATYLNVPDALDAGGVDVGVVGGGDAPRGLPPQDAAAAVHHPLKSGRDREGNVQRLKGGPQVA